MLNKGRNQKTKAPDVRAPEAFYSQNIHPRERVSEMSVSLNLLDDLGAFRVSILKRISEGRSTAVDVVNDVVKLNSWATSRVRIYNDLRRLVAIGYVKEVVVGQRRMAFEITELGTKDLRTALNFYQSV